MPELISLYHTNDLHSHLERWPKLVRTLEEARAAATHPTYLVDIGDALDRQHPLTEATMGGANVTLMNQLNYDAVTLGNNELLGMNHDQLDHLYDDANYDVVISNVTDMHTQTLPKFAQPYKIITTPAGHRLGLLGLTAPFELTMPLLGWQPSTVKASLAHWLPIVRPQVDAVILLSHLGLPTDRWLAEQELGLDVIIGAHTHHLLPAGEWHHQTLLAAAGRHGDHLGEVRLKFDDAGTLTFAQALTTPIDAQLEAPEDEAEIARYAQQGHERLSAGAVVTLPTAYLREPQTELDQSLMDLGLAAIARATDTDLAVLSTGMFLNDLPAGPVTLDDLHTLLPHAVHPMKTRLSGRDLVRLVQEIDKNAAFLRTHRTKGMGFRGREFGEMRWLGLEVADDGQVLVHGVPVDPDQTYVFGSLDHYFFVPFFPTIEIAGENELQYTYTLREIFAQYLTAQAAEGAERKRASKA